MIIGNLTRDPEMRYTPSGKAVTTFSVATNRNWSVDGQPHEEVEFHNVVAWDKLGEICNQYLRKGSKVYVSGRLQTRTWDDQQGLKHYRTEIVADEMIILSSKFEGETPAGQSGPLKPEASTAGGSAADVVGQARASESAKPDGSEDVVIDDKTGMPF